MKAFFNVCLVVIATILMVSNLMASKLMAAGQGASDLRYSHPYLKSFQDLTRMLDVSGSSDNPLRSQQGLRAFTEDVMARDIRYPVFKLQALAKMSLQRNDGNNEGLEKQSFEIQREHFKELEDNIGQVASMDELLAWAKDVRDGLVTKGIYGGRVNPNGKYDRFIQFLERERETVFVSFMNYFKEKWLKPGAGSFNLVRYHVENITFNPDMITEKKIYLNLLIENFKGIHTRIQNVEGLVYKKKYTLNDLENGLHEFRRLVRWVTLNLKALDGFVTLGDLPEAGKIEKDDREVFISLQRKKFTKFDTPVDAPRVTVIPAIPFFQILKMVDLIGDGKEVGQRHFLLSAAWKDYSMSNGELLTEEQAEAIIQDLLVFSGVDDPKKGMSPEKMGAEQMNYYKKKKPIHQLIRYLEEEIKK